MATTRPDTDEASRVDFDAAWDDFFTAIKRARGRVAREHGTDLTLSQYLLLGAVAERTDPSVGELAAASEVSAPTVTRMLDGLERHGVVERRQSQADRRVVTISLTAEGRRLVERKRALFAERRRALYDSLGTDERRQAERLLRRLAAVIEEV